MRVAKLDAEACKALAHVLQIKAFPTVFTFKQGLATDSFVGIPPQEELQAFFLRAVGAPMGQDGKPVPPPKTSFDSDDPGTKLIATTRLTMSSLKCHTSLHANCLLRCH